METHGTGETVFFSAKVHLKAGAMGDKYTGKDCRTDRNDRLREFFINLLRNLSRAALILRGLLTSIRMSDRRAHRP